MSYHILFSFGLILLLGYAAQWLAWRIKVPSILFLLLFGILAGPVFGFLHPDELFGDLLMPFVSVSVAIILFEGGLTLKISEFRKIGRVVSLLISVGVIITWLITAAAAHFVLGINIQIALLIGAVLTVTGPTVISPLLRNIRPRKSVSNILKWESILIDPIGAILAILVFEAILIRELQPAAMEVVLSLLKILGIGVLVGGSFAMLLTFLIRKYWIPDFLHEAATLSAVVTAFLISDYFQQESGLLAATIMGIVLANQRVIPVKNIKDFKENLAVLIIPILFILLSARLSPADMEMATLSGLVFLGLIILVSRPLSVFISTWGSGLPLKEKVFLAAVAPRGIVAAAISAVFALKLESIEMTDIEYLVPITFLVIIGTVTIYGLSAPFTARSLKISQSNPQGVLIAGAQEWAIKVARELKNHNVKVILIDTNERNVQRAKQSGLEAYQDSIIAEDIIDRIELEGIGKFIALTSNDEVNSLAVLHFSEIFDVENMYQLAPTTGEVDKYSPRHLRGRFLFGKGFNYPVIQNKYSGGGRVTSTQLTSKEVFDDPVLEDKDLDEIPLFLIDPSGKLTPLTTGERFTGEKKTMLISLTLHQ